MGGTVRSHGRRQFLRVTAFNPYWEVNGVTFVDRDGYRTVLQNRAWGMVCDSSGMAAS